jgi:F-type H+-transporting ATPase subunit a
MPTQLFLTRILNEHFAAPVTAFLNALHVHPALPEAPITNAFAMELLVFLVLIAYFVAVRVSLNVEKPVGVQHLAEMTHEFVSDQGEQIIGHGYERFVGYLTSLFLFILLSNLLGLIPGLQSPTADVVVPLGFALVTFVYYHYHGARMASRISSNSWDRCGGCIRCCCRLRLFRTARACCRSRSGCSRICLPETC